jgi:hypothetical protein
VESAGSGDNNNSNGALIGGVVGGIAAALLIVGSLIGFFVFRRPADSINVPKPAVSGNDAPSSVTKRTGGHDSLLGPAQPMLATQPALSTTPMPSPAPAMAVAMPPPSAPMAVVDYKDQARSAAVPVVPSTTNDYNVDYKDQTRTVIHEVPVVAVAEMVPFAAAALDVSAASAGSQKTTQSEPPGRIYTEMWIRVPNDTIDSTRLGDQIYEKYVNMVNFNI